MQYPTSTSIDGLLNVPCFTPSGNPVFGKEFTQRNGFGGFFALFLFSCATVIDDANKTTTITQTRRLIFSINRVSLNSDLAFNSIRQEYI